MVGNDGALHYLNMQCGAGTRYPEEGYSFCMEDGSAPEEEEDGVKWLDIGGTWSSDAAILEGLAEECCELSQAALKLARRMRGENQTPKTEEECREALTEEAGDVLCYLWELDRRDLLHLEEVCRRADRKEARWKTRRTGAISEEG